MDAEKMKVQLDADEWKRLQEIELKKKTTFGSRETKPRNRKITHVTGS